FSTSSSATLPPTMSNTQKLKDNPILAIFNILQKIKKSFLKEKSKFKLQYKYSILSSKCQEQVQKIKQKQPQWSAYCLLVSYPVQKCTGQ
ncbi:hypothetical protein L6252_04010, partial [Candidatus Parcubacteria bacterium]|nr:hypothetical protein [Candidatus Parcubacteria bacterium]